ncbi:prefoldin subunit beta [Candidatus Woesearchaeota archaeon]|nr:prefoldin subunit beta [Candidatus Woesearchaeota archaeon]
MAEIKKETEQKIGQLQMFEKSLQNFLAQKQQFQIQLAEIESALKELETAEEAYKIVGNLMVKGDKESLKKDLNEKKDIANLRIKTIEKQEKETREKALSLQQDVMKELQPKK